MKVKIKGLETIRIELQGIFGVFNSQWPYDIYYIIVPLTLCNFSLKPLISIIIIF